MKVTDTNIADLKVIEPTVFGDNRGFFMESYNYRTFNELIGRDVTFVQDNHSRSVKGVLRGLHYQIQQPQAKLVRVVKGSIFDVAVDVRQSSPTFGQWYGIELNEDNRRMLWVPEGFAHGFQVISESADVLYKASDFYAPEHERSILWSDPAIDIDWPDPGNPGLSAKDRQGLPLEQSEVFP
ncbi:MAG: dTDP-4-dehydrorhamnose 3,5-epimerase [Candidatus Thiodiazotropha sp.]